MTMTSQRRVSLVLGSGGARGLAHIGIIEWLEERGYRIESIAGCSMGALVGGIHAAGELATYRDWVCALRRADVLRFMDLTWQPNGLIKGDRIMDELRRMVGEHSIEDLPINFTAVATDIERQREVWFADGPLFDAIRASISVPTVFTPHQYRGMTLLDGGLLDPVPIAPTFRDSTELTIAVDLNGEPAGPAVGDEDAQPPTSTASPERDDDLQGRILAFLDGIGNSLSPVKHEAEEFGMFELMMRSFETMQNAISAVKLAAYAPDVVISVPRDVCDAHEFHRADELIGIGRRLAARAMTAYESGRRG